jgi:hypothetical protein
MWNGLPRRVDTGFGSRCGSRVVKSHAPAFSVAMLIYTGWLYSARSRAASALPSFVVWCLVVGGLCPCRVELTRVQTGLRVARALES